VGVEVVVWARERLYPLSVNRLMLQPVRKQRDAQINRPPLLLVHRHPAGDLVEGAQATATHIVAPARWNNARCREYRRKLRVGGGRLHRRDYTAGCVSRSSRVSHASACSRDTPHISAEGCKLRKKPAAQAGRTPCRRQSRRVARSAPRRFALRHAG